MPTRCARKPTAIIAASWDQPTKNPGTVPSTVSSGKRRRASSAAQASQENQCDSQPTGTLGTVNQTSRMATAMAVTSISR